MSQINPKTVHGVLLSVFDKGVLLTGKSGVGKSEVALSLIDRGHSLIADDIVEFSVQNENKSTILQGSCPAMLKDFLEVRGLGILPIRKLFGDKAIQTYKRLDLIVEIIDGPDQRDADRIHGQHSMFELFGVTVAKVGIPVNPGRPLCVLVESAVRLYQLSQTGYDASEEFIQRSESALYTTREPYDC